MRTLPSAVLALVLTLASLVGSPLPAPLVGTAYAQAASPDSTTLVRVERAFRSGDVDNLLDGSADRLDVIIFGKGASYSRAQAALVLSDFFRRNPPGRVSFEQEVLAEDRRSMIGQYWVANGDSDPVAVFVRLRARGPRWQLRSIRIEYAGGRR
jgi:hypothetical protein